MSNIDYSQITKTLWLKAHVVSKNLDGSLGAIHGIGLTEYMVLHHLHTHPSHALRRIDLAEALSRTASGITKVLLPMEKTGLVTKQSSERDARVSLVKITDSGSEIYQNATVTLENKSQLLLRNVTDSEASSLLTVLEKL